MLAAALHTHSHFVASKAHCDPLSSTCVASVGRGAHHFSRVISRFPLKRTVTNCELLCCVCCVCMCSTRTLTSEPWRFISTSDTVLGHREPTRRVLSPVTHPLGAVRWPQFSADHMYSLSNRPIHTHKLCSPLIVPNCCRDSRKIYYSVVLVGPIDRA